MPVERYRPAAGSRRLTPMLGLAAEQGAYAADWKRIHSAKDKQ